MSQRPPDAPAVHARAAELRAQGQVRYWVVVSYHDGLELLAGRVPVAVRRQVRTDLQRARAEGKDEHAARMREATG